MPDDHARKVDAFLAKNALLVQPTPASCVRVGRDWNTGLTMCLGDCAQDAFNPRRDAEFIRGTLEYSGSDTGVADTVQDISDKHVDHQLWTLERSARTAEAEVERNVVVGVDAGGDDDVDRGPLSDSLDARNES